MKNAYSTYKTANIDTADQGKLILIAYDVAIKHCKQAIEIFSKKEFLEQRTKHLVKAQDAVTELMCSLRLDVGEIAHNLYRLYDYILRSLVEANVKNNCSKVSEVLKYLEDLRDAWSQAISQIKHQTAPEICTGKNLSFSG